ncbi:hypothetical protein [Nevskia soli]|jgi:uncharacterized protein (DUF1778 family)|uniref:hypothetical protein n=1 Tax=Nevskia soli TaxID=418856 RepID=UPI0015D87571|nr:hypothetical protein [Nevskia soli]
MADWEEKIPRRFTSTMGDVMHLKESKEVENIRMGAAPKPAKKPRINLNLSASSREEVGQLAKLTGRSITELVILALSLLKLVIEERRKGNKLIITNADGTPQMQLVIPGL